MDLSDILTHLGEERSQYFNAISPPIIQTSNFAFKDTASFRAAFLDERGHHLYSRGNNPTTEILRKKIAALEKAEDSLVFGSGVAAMACAVMSNVQAGDHIICVENPYSWTHKLVSKLLLKFGVDHTFVSGTDNQEIADAIRPETRVMILESPNSITFKIQDLKFCGEICRAHGITSIIDNTFASPLYQNPHTWGIDIVMHTISKYLNGHSDVVAGVITGTQKMMDKIFASEFMTLGPILSPHDAAMVLRGLRTLPLRMERVHRSGLAVAQYLEAHAKVTQVIHPLLPSFDQHDLALQQMSGAGGLFSFLLKAQTIEDVNAFVDRLERFTLAVSWGGHESLVIPFSIFYNIEGRENPAYPFNLIRLYVGLEDPDYLIQDLENAFTAL